MKQVFILLALCGIYPNWGITQDSKKTPAQTKSNSYNYNEVIVDTTISSPDGSFRFFSYSLSTGDGGPNNTPTVNIRRNFEENQEQVMRQFNEDAYRLKQLINQQIALENERIRLYWQEQKKALFVDIMELTEQEAQPFWSLYNEFSDKKDEITGKKRAINKKLRFVDLYNIDDKEAESLTKEYVNLLSQEANLQQEYYKKYKAVLNPRKILMIYKAEDAFKMMMLHTRGQIIE